MISKNIYRRTKRLLRLVPDTLYIHLYYFAKFRRICNLRQPRTYSEKLQWLKLNYRHPDECKLVDKAAVKDHVATIIGIDHIIPTLAVFDSAQKIDFDSLPESFVLKCTHDSEGLAIVKDKEAADLVSIRDDLRAALKHDFFYIGREPHYKGLRPRVIAEPLLVDNVNGELLDYKFFCFDGVVRAMYIASGRSSGDVKFDYYDADFNPIPLRQSYEGSSITHKRPVRFDEMLAISRKLSKGHPHVRVDLYEVDNKVYFGELTFFSFSGFAPFVPQAWDYTFGDWLALPESYDGYRKNRLFRKAKKY